MPTTRLAAKRQPLYAPCMKKVLFSLFLGIVIGAGGYWWLTQKENTEDLQTARDKVVQGAEKVKETVKEKISEIDVNQIKEELAHSSMVVREKSKKAAGALSDATANARTTATIKGKFLAESGLSSFHINVDTTDGLVTLSGTVSSPDDVARAVRIALDTDGVHKVISTLQVKAAK